jgi:hypothetical protein
VSSQYWGEQNTFDLLRKDQQGADPQFLEERNHRSRDGLPAVF